MNKIVNELQVASIIATTSRALEAIAEPTVREVASTATRTTLSLGNVADNPDHALEIRIDIKKAVAGAPVKSMKKMSMRGFTKTTTSQSQSQSQRNHGRDEAGDGPSEKNGFAPRTSKPAFSFSMGNIGRTFEKTLEEAGLAEVADELKSHEVVRDTRHFYRPAKAADGAPTTQDDEEEDENTWRPTGNAELTAAHYYGGSIVDTGDMEEGTGLLKGNTTGMEILGFVKKSDVRPSFLSFAAVLLTRVLARQIRYEWRMNDLLFVYASAGQTGSQLMLSALINGMNERNSVAIVRYVAKGANYKGFFKMPDPKIGLLFPVVDSPREYCYWCQASPASRSAQVSMLTLSLAIRCRSPKTSATFRSRPSPCCSTVAGCASGSTSSSRQSR